MRYLPIILGLITLLAFIAIAQGATTNLITIDEIYRQTVNESYVNSASPNVLFTITGNATSYYCNVTINGTTKTDQSSYNSGGYVFNNTQTNISLLSVLSDNQHTIRVNCTNTTTHLVNLTSSSFDIKTDVTAPVIQVGKIVSSYPSHGINHFSDLNVSVFIVERWPVSVVLGDTALTAQAAYSNVAVQWDFNDTPADIRNFALNCTYTSFYINVTDGIGRATNYSMSNMTFLPCIEGQNGTAQITTATAAGKALAITFETDAAITSGITAWLSQGKVYNSSYNLCNYSSTDVDVSSNRYQVTENVSCNVNITRKVGSELIATIAPDAGVGTTSASSNFPFTLTGVFGLLVAIGAGAGGVLWERRHSTV